MQGFPLISLNLSFSNPLLIQDEGAEVEEIEMEVDEPAEEEPIPPVVPTPSVPALPSVSSNVKIRKDYNPKGKKEVFRCLNFLEFEYIASFFIVFKGFPLTVAPLA